jgi:hypothetical protein
MRRMHHPDPMLFTFAKLASHDTRTALEIVRVVAWVLAEKYEGCTAEVLSYDRDGDRVTLSLCIAPDAESVECFEWFTQQLADQSLVLVRDRYFARAMRRIGAA